MFKLGGQADQGTGIMSTVEPRQNYMFGNIAQPLTPFQNTYTELPAYAMGGRIGYANGPGPVLPGTQTENPFTRFAPSNIPKAGVPQVEAKTGIEYLIKAGYLPEQTAGRRSTARDIMNAEQRFEQDRKEKMSRSYEAQALTEEKAGFERAQPTVVPKKPVTKEAEDTNPLNEVRQEAKVLKDLLRDEGLTTAENAFIIAKALSTPGGINAKIQAAANLAMPIIKERSKLDREVTLEAYKTSKEMEKARIAAGKKDAAAQLEADIVANKIRQAKSIPGNVIVGEDGITRYKTPGSDRFKTADEIQAEVQTIRVIGPSNVTALQNAIRELQLRIEKLRAEKNPNLEAIRKAERELEGYDRQLKGGFKTGGRVKKQFGGMMDETMDTTTKEVEETNTIVDTNVAGTPMKPVQKLSYEEIRSRLPQEITNDIVQLLANSAEALQDFAYIRTQQDVNQFNVKYGVNLILPQGA